MPVKIIVGDARQVLSKITDPVDCCVTSPPYYGLRDYDHAHQIGHEETVDQYVDALVETFRIVKGLLPLSGTLWLNLGDSYASFRDGKVTPDNLRGGDQSTTVDKGKARNRMRSTFSGTEIKHKDLIGIPWRVAFALQRDGWYLRQDIVWAKPNPNPESVQDRCTSAHEYLFLLTKSPSYYFDNAAIQERIDVNETRNKRSVWSVPVRPFADAHFATYPPELIVPCVAAGCPSGGTLLDPFGGAGTTGLVADRLGRNAILVELNESYAKLARERIDNDRGGLLDRMEA